MVVAVFEDVTISSHMTANSYLLVDKGRFVEISILPLVGFGLLNMP